MSSFLKKIELERFDRIVDLFEESNLTKAELARQLKAKPQSLNTWFNNKKFPNKHIPALAEILNTTDAYLIIGKKAIEQDLHTNLGLFMENNNLSTKGVSKKTGFTQEKIEQLLVDDGNYNIEIIRKIEESFGVYLFDHPNATSFKKDTFELSALDVYVSAGNGLTLFEENIVKTLCFDTQRFEDAYKVKPTTAMRIVNVKGGSMSPTFNDGDMLLVDTSEKNICDGVFVFRVDNDLYLKRLQKIPGKIIAISDNQKYQPFDLPKEAKVIAKVIAAWDFGLL